MKIAILLLGFGLQIAEPDTTHLSIEQAIARALAANPALRAERATADARGALPAQASQAFLPTIDLGLTGVRTNDPVAVFGLKLRQATFAMSDFDIGALNDPNPSGGWDAVATVQMPILAPEGLFGFAAASRKICASASARRWADAALLRASTSWAPASCAAVMLASSRALSASNVSVVC